MLPFAKKARNSIHQRCRSDETTRLRLKYNPYYHTFDRQVGSHVWKDGQELIMMSSNDYLGLGDHPKVREAAHAAIEKWGTSTTGARLANGSRSYHTELEERLAAHLGKEACHVSVAGYLACMASIQSFAQKGDLVVVDRNVHSSLWSGIGLTQAKVERFGHNSAQDLREVLSVEKPETPKIVVFEGVYSMEGHIGKVPEILEACAGHNCFFVLDDAHGFGVLGPKGEGTAGHFGVTDRVDILTGSFSKALSSTGGFIAGDRDLIEYLRTHSKQTIFSAALSPPQAGAATAALGLLESEPEIRERLWSNTRRYKQMLLSLGFDIWESETPATPIIMGNRERAFRFWKLLFEHGLFTTLSVAPAVPPGKDLIRTSISARHTEADLNKMEAVFTKLAKKI